MISALAALVVFFHLAFVVFAVAGGLLALRWIRVAWIHLPVAAWATYIELSGGICPLTPLENTLRARAGLQPYTGDFIAQYVFPVLYPSGLTRDVQIALGVALVILNAGVYWWAITRARRPS